MEESSIDSDMDSYANCITQLSTSPTRELHLLHLSLLKKLGLSEELQEARESMAADYPLDEELWLDWLKDRKEVLAKDDISGQIELIELFKRSILEFLSIPLLIEYSNHFINNYYSSQGLSKPISNQDSDEEDEEMHDDLSLRKIGEKDEVLETIFGLDTVRGIREEVLQIGGLHLTESSKLWKVWKEFEEDLLKMNQSSEQLSIVESLYLARLAVPHIGIDSTFSNYSSHVTKFNNSNYSTLLPIANKIYSIAKSSVDIREAKEAELKKAKSVYWAYLNYIRWELEVKKPDFALVTCLFERAVKEHPQNIEIWENYLDFIMGLPKSIPTNPLVLGQRSIKNCPQSGLLYSINFRLLEKLEFGSDEIESLFSKAMNSNLFEGNVEELVLIYQGRIDFHRREVESLLEGSNQEDVDPSMGDLIIAILIEGIKKINNPSLGKKKGDLQLRLEKYLIRVYERFGLMEEVSDCWERLCKSNETSYAIWFSRAEFETKRGNVKKAQQIYLEASSIKFLDFPEYLLNLWLNFSHQNSSLAELEFTMTKVKRQMRGIEARRRREAVAAGISIPNSSTIQQQEEIAEEVEEERKRERSEEFIEPPLPKKVKIESIPVSVSVPAVEEQKRDRENSTIFVISPLEANTTEEDLNKLFADCGEIRECKIKTIGQEHLAMLEFIDKKSVLAAQTKDKKRINGIEISVSIAWKSCLYITNFPESYDKIKIEEMFSQYGTIFDTRWPSKRFKNTRRFCYVQFTKASSAESALSLHQTELDDGLKLTVYISDPTRKKSRTDLNANNKELYIGGLSKFVKEFDLKKLFEPFGEIKGIRLTLDDKGECKGFAFVEFEEESAAIASLALNNHELKKRRMSVTIAQSRITGIQKPTESGGPNKRLNNLEIENKSLRILNIPSGTEEAIIQQTFEKIARIRLVKMEVGSSEAVIEFETAAEAGKVLLLKDTIQIDNINLEILTEGLQARTTSGKKPATATTSNTSGASGGIKMLPRQASRGRGKIGGIGGRGGIRRGGIGSSTATGTGSTTTAVASNNGASSSKSQDDFRALLNKKSS